MKHCVVQVNQLSFTQEVLRHPGISIVSYTASIVSFVTEQ